MSRRRLRLGTRGSQLALRQATWVAQRLRQSHAGLEVELVPITTGGDRASALWERRTHGTHEAAPQDPDEAPGLTAEVAFDPERAAAAGAFVRELERALLDGRCDLAVHSLKDVPTRLPDGLVLAAFPAREDPRDAIVLPTGRAAEALEWAEPPALQLLPPQGRVGTSSLRRLLQLRALRPDLQGVVVRGNVDTRLARLDAGRADALVLAGAGLVRLGLGHRISAWLSAELMVPAPGQGALAVECRADDRAVLQLVRAIDDPAVRAQVAAERAFLAVSGAGCRWPVGALAVPEACGELRIVGLLAVPESQFPGARGDGQVDGWVWRRGSVRVPQDDEERLAQAGAALARELLSTLMASPPGVEGGQGKAARGLTAERGM